MSWFRSMRSRSLKALCYVMMLAFLPMTTLQAAMVGTESVIQTEQMQYDRTQILDRLQAEDAQDALALLGVDATEIEDRVANMTAEELAQFNSDINEMPAGGIGIVGVIIFIVLLLIVLDLLGATNVFPAIRPIN